MRNLIFNLIKPPILGKIERHAKNSRAALAAPGRNVAIQRIDQPVFAKSPWGWLPLLTFTAAAGVLVTAGAMISSINNSPFAMLQFWLGVTILVAPIGVRMLCQDLQFREALSLAILAGEALYLVSSIRFSIQNISYDAFLHFRTASDILTTSRLFTPNALLPVSPFYPGLEIVTTALVNLTGLSIQQAGTVVVFAARWIMISGLFLIFFGLTRSPRTAGTGCLIYMGSSTFVIFNAQFAYESLSLPLAIFLFWLVSKRSVSLRSSTNWAILAILTGMVVAVTHHVISFFMVGILLLWTVISTVKKLRKTLEYIPIQPTLIMGVFVLAWLFLVGNITIGYLHPYVKGTQTSLAQFLSGYPGDRPVISASQTSDQISERITSILSMGFLLLGSGVGLFSYMKFYKQDPFLRNTLAQIMVILGLLYPLLPLLRLNGSTWEVSNRLSGAVFLGLGYLTSLGLAHTENLFTLYRLQRVIAIPAFVVIIIAGIIGGSHPAIRLPGSYVVEGDGRSIDSYSLSAAGWAEQSLSAGRRMAGDRGMSLLMGSLGRQTMVFGGGKVSLSPIFLKPELSKSDFEIIQKMQIHYLVIDQRITQGLPLYGYFFESWEQQVVPTRLPLDPAVLNKFDSMPGVGRVYDNGNIRIFDVRGLSDGSK